VRQASHNAPPVSTKMEQNLDINNTWLRRWATLIALRTTGRFYSRQGICRPLSKHLIVKSDAFVHQTEASTMNFVAENTSIPVPKVHCSFIHNGRAYIVMERIQGESLGDSWAGRTQQSKDKITAQLRAIFEELRALKPPGAGIESCVGGSLFDCRLPQSDRRFGPFPSVQAFHRWLRDDISLEDVQPRPTLSEEDLQEIKAMVIKQDGPWPPPVFTHGDLNWPNILVRGDDVVGIIDWEFSGWYPHYWEYTSSWTNHPLATIWQDYVGEILDKHPEELKMEMTRQRLRGGF